MVAANGQAPADRIITGFSFDETGETIVHLSCGHRFHARHDPPWQERPWAVDDASRRTLLGSARTCPYCDPASRATPAAPPTLELVNLDVLPEWIDYNGHMNVAYYVLAFDRGVDALLEAIGIDETYISGRRLSTFTAEIHVCYLAEVHKGDPLRITGRLLAHDARRMHFFLEMHHASRGFLSATLEQVAIHVDLEARRAAPFPEDVIEKLDELRRRHAGLPAPRQAGRTVGL